MSDERERARKLLDAFALGERIELEGLPFYCECMRQMCSGEHKKRGECACARWEAKKGGEILDGILKRK